MILPNKKQFGTSMKYFTITLVGLAGEIRGGSYEADLCSLSFKVENS